jgi:hypothetical protein
MTEHYQTFFNFKVEKDSNMTIGYLFGVIEGAKDGLGISEYTLSQTTLEQIFNMFANQPEYTDHSQERMSLNMPRDSVHPN